MKVIVLRRLAVSKQLGWIKVALHFSCSLGRNTLYAMQHVI